MMVSKYPKVIGIHKIQTSCQESERRRGGGAASNGVGQGGALIRPTSGPGYENGGEKQCLSLRNVTL